MPGTFPSFKREIAAAGKRRGRWRGARGKSAFLPERHERRLYQSRVLAADILACLGDFNCSVIAPCRGLKSAACIPWITDRRTRLRLRLRRRKLDKVDRCPPRNGNGIPAFGFAFREPNVQEFTRCGALFLAMGYLSHAAVVRSLFCPANSETFDKLSSPLSPATRGHETRGNGK